MKKLLGLVLITLFFTGCKVLNPSAMLLTPKDFKYDPLPTSTVKDFRLKPNDRFYMQLYTNDGFRLLDLISSESNSSNITNSSVAYTIESDGMVKLPILGRVTIADLTEREAESMLEQKFSEFYVKPFVMISVSNRQVLVFPGLDGLARPVVLAEGNSNLLQVIALAGGISKTGKAFNIKVIRGELKSPQIYHFNIRNIESLKECDFVLQSNDIIYIEARPQYARNLFTEVGPYLSILTTTLLAINLFRRQL